MNSDTIFDVAGIRERIGKIEESMAREGFWNDVEEATRLNKEKSDLEGTVVPWEQARREVDYLLEFLELAQSEEDGGADQDLVAELGGQAAQVEKMLRAMEFRRKLGGEHDKLGAIVSINAGSGGTEAQDWAEMMLRMYLRWAESTGYRTEITDIMAGDEAGIKNVTFTVEGDYAYGYLRSEVGVHRLVRISPFDAGGRRHTSFASVFVIPAIDDEVVVELDEDHLRVDTYRASGAGGQHVNKTDSAVRLTYDYNGEKIVVQCQNELAGLVADLVGLVERGLGAQHQLVLGVGRHQAHVREARLGHGVERRAVVVLRPRPRVDPDLPVGHSALLLSSSSFGAGGTLLSRDRTHP